jgi:hypothetical protein
MGTNQKNLGLVRATVCFTAALLASTSGCFEGGPATRRQDQLERPTTTTTTSTTTTTRPSGTTTTIPPVENYPRVQSSNLQYLGAFRVPSDAAGDPSNLGYSYSEGVITFNPARNSLFLVGHPWTDLVGEISIPAVVNANSVSGLNQATTLLGL